MLLHDDWSTPSSTPGYGRYMDVLRSESIRLRSLLTFLTLVRSIIEAILLADAECGSIWRCHSHVVRGHFIYYYFHQAHFVSAG